MSPSRRSKTMTPPPGEDGTPPPPPGTSTIQKMGSIGPKNRQTVASIKCKLLVDEFFHLIINYSKMCSIGQKFVKLLHPLNANYNLTNFFHLIIL